MAETTTATKKVNSHVATALRHLEKRQLALINKRDAIQDEIEQIGSAIMSLEPARDESAQGEGDE